MSFFLSRSLRLRDGLRRSERPCRPSPGLNTTTEREHLTSRWSVSSGRPVQTREVPGRVLQDGVESVGGRPKEGSPKSDFPLGPSRVRLSRSPPPPTPDAKTETPLQCRHESPTSSVNKITVRSNGVLAGDPPVSEGLVNTLRILKLLPNPPSR